MGIPPQKRLSFAQDVFEPAFAFNAASSAKPDGLVDGGHGVIER